MNTKLTRTPSSASNRKTFTISLWFKIGKHPFTDSAGGTSREIIGQTSSSYFRCMLKSDSTMRIYDESGFNFNTNRKFRDKSAFYHLVIRVDTTQATANDRVRIYINGLDERTVGGYSTSTTPSQNQDFAWNTTSVHQIGGHSGNYDYFSGVMSHIHHCDGTSLAPTVFGSIDSTTGEWKINTSPSFTPGTNGFTILKDGNTITDQSANSNNFALASGTLTKTEDNPSNVFATINPLDNIGSSSFSNGNLQIDTGNSNYTYNNSTLGYTSGKYYWEAKITHTSNYDHIGITSKGSTGTTQYMYASDYNYTLKSDNGVLKYKAGGSTTDVSGWSGASFGVGNIISIAHDVDNNKIYFAKDGAWMNSANPNTPTGGITTTSLSSTDTGVWLPAFGDENNGTYTTWQVNFGNGYFGTTAVASAGTNASNNGIFEYNVPTGYTALSTKGLNL